MRRSRRCLVAGAIVVGLAAGPGRPPVTGQSRSQPAARSGGDPTSWQVWLANAVNLLRLVEVTILLAGVYQLWARRDERRKADEEAAKVARKAANYQAWQVVNSAQGKGGSGGRIDALEDLNRNGISLAGVRLDGAWLENIRLVGAQLRNASLREANLHGGDLHDANLESADLTDATLIGADLRDAHLKAAILTGAHLATADLRGADLTGVREWQLIKSASYLNIDGVRNAPAGFRDWMVAHGAVDSTTPEPIDTDSTYSSVFRAI